MSGACARCDWTDAAATPGCGNCAAFVHAALAGHPCCVVCRAAKHPRASSLRDDEHQTCLPCQGRAARTLAYLRRSWPQVAVVRTDPSAQRLGGGGSKSASTTVPGGLGAVLRGGGRSSLEVAPLPPGCAGADNRASCRRCFGATVCTGMLHRLDEQPGDGISVRAELTAWVGDWREYRPRQDRGPATADVDSTLGWLQQRLPWAAQQHPQFAEFAARIAEIETWVRHLLDDSDTPVRDTSAACLDCSRAGEPVWLVRELDTTGHGWSDDETCPRCRRVYDAAARLLAVAELLRQSAA